MKRASTLLVLWLGCSPAPESVEELSKTVEPIEAETSPVAVERPAFPPDNLMHLADADLVGKFQYVSFAWANGPPNWEISTREERSQALFGTDGGFTRITYPQSTVRIREVYYSPERIKSRWQEELRNGEWVRHGPCVFWSGDGNGGDICFYLDGEVEGTRTKFDSDGNVLWTQAFKNGILQPELDE